MRIALCVLCRNERPCLEILWPRVPAPGPAAGFDELVVIDGGSTDGSVEYLEAAGVRVIAQTRRGRGDAYLTAMARVPADAWIFFSPDGNEDPADLPKFRGFLAGGADVVIASRMSPGAVNEEDAHWLRPRKWANKIFNGLANLLFRKTGAFVTDSINGYRAITAPAARRLALDARDYTIEYQMTIRALHERLTIAEFPTVEGPRLAGETGARSLPTGLRFVRRLAREVARSRGWSRRD